METADALLNKILYLADLEALLADELNELATDFEEQKKSLNKYQVAGNVVSAAGSVALLTATFFTGGAAVPVLVAGGNIVSDLGLYISTGLEFSGMIIPELDKKENTIYENINNTKNQIQTLIKSLADEGTKAGVPEEAQEEYLTERILRAMAKRNGLILDFKVSITELVCKLFKQGLDSATVRVAGQVTCFLIRQLVLDFLETQARKKAVIWAVKSSVSTASKQAAKGFGSKATKKALKRISLGVGICGVVFSGAELIYNCMTLNKGETEKSKSLKEKSKEMKTRSVNMKKELDDINRLLKGLAEAKNCIESQERSPTQKKKLIDFAKEQCEDEAVRTWLEENENSGAFLKLVDMFCFLHEEFNKQREKIDQENIDIIFVAHGSIEEPLIPANSLLPLSTIQDVVLYSPWNCALTAHAAYGVATGRLEPKHRVFACGDEKNCKEGHQPTKLPGDWNSMKDAAKRKKMIPTISVSPLRVPKDGAWERVVFLQSICGQPGKNRILIPFLLPEDSKSFSVPFFVVTLAFSLVLYFSKYKATIHLTACLGRCEKMSKSSEIHLHDQYSYTTDKTAMGSSVTMLAETFLSRLFEKMFG